MSYETALWPLQKAIFQRLSSDVTLSGVVTGVFDHVPENQPYPYVVIGEPNELPFDTKTSFGEEISLVIHVWSNYPGKKEAYNILGACQRALAYKLSLEGFRLLKVDRAGKQVFDDIDPAIKHGVLRMRYTISNL